MESRIKRNIYILLGVTVFLLLAMCAGWFFALVRPQRELLTKAEADYKTRKAVADRLEGALSDLKKTEDRREYLKGQLAFFRQRYRNLYFGDIGTGEATDTLLQKKARLTAWRRWLNEYYSEYGTELTATLREMADSSAVQLTQTVKVDAPPKAPEDVVAPANGLFKPVGGGSINLTVTGPFENVMDFFNRVNRSPILLVIGTLKLNAQGAAGAPGAQGAPTGPLASSAPGGAPAVTPASTEAPPIIATFSATPYLLASGPGVPLGGNAAAAPAGSAAPSGIPGATGSPSGSPSSSSSMSNSASSSSSSSSSSSNSASR